MLWERAEQMRAIGSSLRGTSHIVYFLAAAGSFWKEEFVSGLMSSALIVSEVRGSGHMSTTRKQRAVVADA